MHIQSLALLQRNMLYLRIDFRQKYMSTNKSLGSVHLFIQIQPLFSSIAFITQTLCLLRAWDTKQTNKLLKVFPYFTDNCFAD